MKKRVVFRTLNFCILMSFFYWTHQSNLVNLWCNFQCFIDNSSARAQYSQHGCPSDQLIHSGIVTSCGTSLLTSRPSLRAMGSKWPLFEALLATSATDACSSNVRTPRTLCSAEKENSPVLIRQGPFKCNVNDSEDGTARSRRLNNIHVSCVRVVTYTCVTANSVNLVPWFTHALQALKFHLMVTVPWHRNIILRHCSKICERKQASNLMKALCVFCYFAMLCHLLRLYQMRYSRLNVSDGPRWSSG
jgi:hypothetical protein